MSTQKYVCCPGTGSCATGGVNCCHAAFQSDETIYDGSAHMLRMPEPVSATHERRWHLRFVNAPYWRVYEIRT